MSVPAHPAQFGTGDYQEWIEDQGDRQRADELAAKCDRFLPPLLGTFQERPDPDLARDGNAAVAHRVHEWVGRHHRGLAPRGRPSPIISRTRT